MKTDFAGRTDTGRVRARNEDALLQRPERALFAVADGMGGHAGGDIASRIAVDILDERTIGDNADVAAELEAALRAGHEAILKAAAADSSLSGMGTTITALRFSGPGRCVIAHVGDSRAYRYRDGELDQLTRDQTWVQEQVDAGLISPGQAKRHPYSAMLTGALGIAGIDLDVELIQLEPRPGDLFLLCTDGLVARLDDGDISQILAADDDVHATADALVAAANAAGGPDNITVALIRVASGE
jgi:serine/threonine protein phosphatase PrpC